ncbi:VapE domain-containing protein [uncultured Bacteroides sp.]|uniref:VapE domain-containing protein n=1 Tax=uncultured Bacteroides sp. TaxID=162156 RepID=UPI0026254C4E|nr:VapE domain-containing protein [uncultured Bacteroides sp.]
MRKIERKILNLVVKKNLPMEKTESVEPVAESKPTMDGLQDRLKIYLWNRYDFRFNNLTESPEYAVKGSGEFQGVDKRALNSFCLEANNVGIACWDKDVARLLYSYAVTDFHPIQVYMERLPEWDGKDRVRTLAERVSKDELWVMCFRRWLLGVVAHWCGKVGQTANTFAPLLVSNRQGMCKSTFCRMLMPDSLHDFYLDKFDLTAQSDGVRKLGFYGLINMDEFDRYTHRQLATLKNLMQLRRLSVRKAYQSSFSRMERVASFIGTSNERFLLKDTTGSRRFFCIEVSEKINCDPLEHKQLYAQLKHELEAGERYWFTADEEQQIQQHNQSFYQTPPEEEVLKLCYRMPEAGEQFMEMTAMQIFSSLKRRYPSAMCGVSAAAFSKKLMASGFERVHRKNGNFYRVAGVESVQ